MAITKYNGIASLLLISALCLQAPRLEAQSATTQTPSSARGIESRQVIVERRPSPTQVVTVLHTLNGMKMLRLLIRASEQVGIENFDDAFQMSTQVHTNIIAGLALDDGQTIVAWLPEAEIEVETTFAPFGDVGPAAKSQVASTPQSGATRNPGAVFASGFAAAPDLTVIERDGRRQSLRYVGLDGITGLSLLKIKDGTRGANSAGRDTDISIGQNIRLFSPEPVAQAEQVTGKAMYIRIGETKGQVVGLLRGSSGRISRIRIKAAKLSSANIGAVVVNEVGQTVGIVEDIDGVEATVLPPGVIHAAAERVLSRRSSVPRPWLGVRGKPLAGIPLDQVISSGWERDRAMTLVENKKGILLTSIAPGSPAAIAALHPGDVIVGVNGREVKSTDEFSLLLDEVGARPARFTLVRLNRLDSQSVVVKLSEAAFDPLLTMKMFEVKGAAAMLSSMLVSRGIEAIGLRAPAANQLGASGGLLVVFVQPNSPAFAAGVRSGDVIEGINGNPLSNTLAAAELADVPGEIYLLNVLRSKQPLVLRFPPKSVP